MRRLPPLVVGSQTWTLPFSDRSAASLVEELLRTPATAGPVRSTDCLALDPPLMLWAASRAWSLDGLQPRSLKRLVDWLRNRAARVLLWPETAEKSYHSSGHGRACGGDSPRRLRTT